MASAGSGLSGRVHDAIFVEIGDGQVVNRPIYFDLKTPDRPGGG